MLLRCIRAENKKLRRSVIWLLFLGVPVISAVYGAFNYWMNLEILTDGWYSLWTQYTLFYATFFSAPLIGVYASCLWRLEHHGYNWNLIMSAPIHPLALFFAKFCVIAKMVLLTQAWLFLLYIIGGRIVGLNDFPPLEIVLWVLWGVPGSLAVIALQLLFSMIIRNFAFPVLLALGGSIIGLLVTSQDMGLYWPYSLMLLGMNSNRAEDMIGENLVPFLLSCGVFLSISFLASHIRLTKWDVSA